MTAMIRDDKLLLELQVCGRTWEAEGVVCLNLVAPHGDELPAFEAGAHVDLHLPSGLVRQYSLCNDPIERGRYRIAVLLDPQTRGGSVEAHQSLLPGTTVTVGRPRNLFAIADPNAPAVMIGGGIGITPLLAMAYQQCRRGSDFVLHYCARTRARAAFRDELAKASFAAKVRTYYDEDLPARQFAFADAIGRWDTRQHLYLCGPTGFLAALVEHAHIAGWPESHIHLERFSAVAPVDGESFQVETARSGITVSVPRDKTIADVLLEAGIEIDVSCEQGFCGTCVTGVLAGIPDHRDDFLTHDEKLENNRITICCSRSKTPKLVLDL